MMKPPGGSAVGSWIGTLLPVLGTVLAFQWLIYPRITDPDAFYHIGHAAQYLAAGPFDSDFPWTAWSIIGELGADLWYGLHLLAAPFALAADPATGARVAAVVLAVVGVGLVGAVAHSHRWVAAPLWPVLFLLAVPNTLFRYLSLRPEVLSIPLALVLLSAVARRRSGVVFAASALSAWVHLSMWWLSIGVVVTTGVAELVLRRRKVGETEPGPGFPALLGWTALGIGAGAVLRPNPVGAIELAWIQIAELLFEKTGGAPLTFATELSPIGAGSVFAMAAPLLILWIAAVGWSAVQGGRAEPEPEAPGPDPAEARMLLASTLLAAGFLVLTLLVARRSLVYWTAFAIPAVAIVSTRLAGVRPVLVRRLLLAATIPLFAWCIQRNDLNARFIAIQPDRLADTAEWIEEASVPGDLVFNTHWDAFGPLFAHNRMNRYIGGMDPIFQFTADPRRYWMFHHLSTGTGTAVTCPAAGCTPEGAIDVWEAVRGEFGARWLVAEPARDSRLIAYLDTDPRFRRSFDGRDAVVFEVAVAAGPGQPRDANSP